MSNGMKESKFLKALKAINDNLPSYWVDDVNLNHSIFQCYKFFEIPVNNPSDIVFEDERSIKIKLDIKRRSGNIIDVLPTHEMPKFIICNRCIYKDEDFEMAYWIGWTNGDYSSPEIFVYHIINSGL